VPCDQLGNLSLIARANVDAEKTAENSLLLPTERCKVRRPHCLSLRIRPLQRHCLSLTLAREVQLHRRHAQLTRSRVEDPGRIALIDEAAQVQVSKVERRPGIQNTYMYGCPGLYSVNRPAGFLCWL
jgi:hypothetical protein